MALATYDGLKAAISATLMRGDLDSFIPDWITMCEASMNRVLKSQGSVVRAYIGDGGADERYENLPGDFLELVAPPRVNSTDDPSQSTTIDYVTPRVMDDLWSDASGLSYSTPRFFTIVGGQMQFYPQPNGDQIEIAYRQGVPPLATADGGVNALLLEAPDLYLYGSLIHSAPFLREDERVPVWQQFYNNAVGDFNLVHLRKRYTGGPLRMRPRRPIG